MSRLLVLMVSFVCFGQSVVPVSDGTFDLHSSFWINLDHFLRKQASDLSEPLDGSPAWGAAVAYYRKNLVPQKKLSDDAIRLNLQLSELESVESIQSSSLNSELIAILEAAATVYRERWWAEHDRSNRAWIQAAGPLLARHAAELRRDLSKAYSTTWPTKPIRTDVVWYASAEGAYTSDDPAHITISSSLPGYQGGAMLEMLFHEASHVTFTKVYRSMASEARAQNRLYQRRELWHAVLFYTAGTLVERRIPGYTQYAVKNGLFERVWPGARQMMDRDWRPYLDGQIDLPAAIRRMIANYSVEAGTNGPGR